MIEKQDSIDSQDSLGSFGSVRQNADGSVFYPYPTTRANYWPPLPGPEWVDARTEFTFAVERAWWFNWSTGKISVSFITPKGARNHLRVFREYQLDHDRFEYMESIKHTLDRRQVEVDENELRIVQNDEYRILKKSAYEELMEKQLYMAGVRVGDNIRDFKFPGDLIRCPECVVGDRQLDTFPYNFGARGCPPDFLGMPELEEGKFGNYLWIKKVGIKNMTRDDLRAHLNARGESYKKGEFTQSQLVDKLFLSWNNERSRRKIHWFCQANDDCRDKGTCVSYDPDENGHEMVDIGPYLITSWDAAKGRKPLKISIVYAHLREKHWTSLIQRGYGETVV